MVSDNLNEQMMWSITLTSKRDLSDKERDFTAELVSEEARKVTEPYRFILHDIVESKRYSKILIEGSKAALSNLLLVIRGNLPYEISYTRLM